MKVLLFVYWHTLSTNWQQITIIKFSVPVLVVCDSLGDTR